MPQKKSCTPPSIHATITSHCEGPVMNSTTHAQVVRFHDDNALHDVHAKGSPTTVDKDNISKISQILDRTEADVRGVKAPHATSGSDGAARSGPTPAAPNSASAGSEAPPSSRLAAAANSCAVAAAAGRV